MLAIVALLSSKPIFHNISVTYSDVRKVLLLFAKLFLLSCLRKGDSGQQTRLVVRNSRQTRGVLLVTSSDLKLLKRINSEMVSRSDIPGSSRPVMVIVSK